MTPKITLSPSTISLFHDCPRCFWLQFRKGLKRPSSGFPSLPNGMDRILKEHFDGHRHSGSQPKELEGFEGGLFQDMGKLSGWRNYREGLRCEDQASGIGLMGLLDDLFVTSDGLFVPLDFKTKGSPVKEVHEANKSQMSLYSFLLEKNGLKTAGFAILLFYSPKRINSYCNVEFHAEPVKITADWRDGERIFMEAVKCIQGEEPAKGDCGWCRLL